MRIAILPPFGLPNVFAARWSGSSWSAACAPPWKWIVETIAPFGALYIAWGRLNFPGRADDLRLMSITFQPKLSTVPTCDFSMAVPDGAAVPGAYTFSGTPPLAYGVPSGPDSATLAKSMRPFRAATVTERVLPVVPRMLTHPALLKRLTMEYFEIVPALPQGIGLVEVTPRSASAYRGVCYSHEDFKQPTRDHACPKPGRLRAAKRAGEPIRAIGQSIGTEEFTGSEPGKVLGLLTHQGVIMVRYTGTINAHRH